MNLLVMEFCAMVFCFSLAGCAGQKTAIPRATTDRTVKSESMDNQFSAQPGDAKLTRGSVQIDKGTITATRDTSPAILNITGSLPTPCHELRLKIPDTADSQGTLRVEAWS